MRRPKNPSALYLDIRISDGGLFERVINEFFYYRDWRGVKAEEFIVRLDAFLRYYNEERIKESLGWMSPVQYRESLGLAA